jgi:hypothetical protein
VSDSRAVRRAKKALRNLIMFSPLHNNNVPGIPEKNTEERIKTSTL